MYSRLRFLPILILLVAVNSAQAFNGQRKGLIFGGSAGLGITHVMSKSYTGDNSAWRGAPAFSFRLGWGSNNRTLFFIGAKSSLAYMDRIAHAYDVYIDAMGEDNLKGLFAKVGSPIVLPILWMGGAHSTFGLIGASYYFKDQAPSYFIEGTLGVGIIPDEFRDETLGGFGMSLGGGYEFSPHTSLRFDFLYGTEERDKTAQQYQVIPEDHSSAFSLLVMIDILAY